MPSEPESFRFDDDGETPNNPRLPLIVYREAVPLDGGDPAATFEKMFARHGWANGWRNGIFDFLHFHIHTHEVLGIARGSARVEFGGARGRAFDLKAGDVAVLPAGCGHRRLSASRDLLVVGAYPHGGDAEYQTPSHTSHGAAVAAIASTPVPDQDPVFGKDGPLSRLWRA
ncbi:MAG TPA: cupin domain-containing protein [Reyranella sp.]|jgi:uncharacterized protein YjlB|nr:cupin domain-containing protein [Reyranella sp.]